MCNVICNITRSDGPGIKLGFRTRSLSDPIRSIALRRFTVLHCEKDIKSFADKRPEQRVFFARKTQRDVTVRQGRANKLVTSVLFQIFEHFAKQLRENIYSSHVFLSTEHISL